MSTVNIKLTSTIGNKSTNIFFQPKCLFSTFICQVTFLTHSWHISRMSKSSLLVLIHDIYKIVTSIWGWRVHWGAAMKMSKMGTLKVRRMRTVGFFTLQTIFLGYLGLPIFYTSFLVCHTALKSPNIIIEFVEYLFVLKNTICEYISVKFSSCESHWFI